MSHTPTANPAGVGADPEVGILPAAARHVPDDTEEVDIAKVKDLEELLHEAEKGTAAEHNMGLLQALKLYPKASMWSILLSFAVIMEGYDVILIGNFYAYPAFTQRFGTRTAKGTYQISANWQAGIGNSVTVGQIIGLIINGIVAERYGYRKVMITALVFLIGFIFMFFFASSLGMILAAEILCGIPWGIFQTLTTSYAAEVAPVALRGYLTTWVNACWGIGQLIAVAVLRGLLSRTDQWGWRIPYAIQWVWPVPLLVVSYLAPESPWWLVRKNRLEDAKRSLERLTTRHEGDGFDVDQTVAMMRHTHLLEKNITSGASYIDCFRGIELRRTEIVCGCWAAQQFCGSAFMNYSTYFFTQAGLSTTHSFDLTMGQYAINTGGPIIAWTLMAWGVGRRSLFLYGTLGMGAALFIIGGVGTIGTQPSAWASAIMLLVWSVAYQSSVGSVAYSLVSELSSRRLLIKSINIGRGFYCVIAIIKGQLTPRMINPTAWNWGPKSAFFWAGTNILCLVWIYFRLPEPSGLTFAEIDKLFEHKISARKFKQAGIDMFGQDRAHLAEIRETVGADTKAEGQHANVARF